ncbi:MAG: S41 family peptidase [Lachnospiraceae bacterium]|nr:S41 family peptidase [Lachnospiraceae bacterium]
MEKNRRFGKGFLCGVLVSAVVAGAGIGISQNMMQEHNAAAGKTESTADVRLDLDQKKVDEKIGQIEEVINQNYLNEVDKEEIEAGIYKGMISGLGDPYAAYYTQDELKALRESTSGAYQGIGAKLSQDPDSGAIQVVTCFEGTPAQKAGLLPGDILYTVNGTEVTGKDLTDVVSMIKTAEGDQVHIQVARDGEKDYLDFDVERSEVSVPTVAYKMMDNKIGYVAISEFDEVTAKQFQDALADLDEQGMEKLIIDLRNNLGGLLDTCCEMLRQILPEGRIVYTEDKDGNQEEYNCDGAHAFKKPLVVLVNGYSASAAEIFSGAVKDYGIGTLVGTKTFGKGIVQRIVGLQDGTAVKLTISKYFTPNGTDIHQKGIEPDVTVELDESLKNKVTITEEEDNQLQKAISILQEEKQDAE